MSNRIYGDWIANSKVNELPTEKEILQKYDSKLSNEIYSRVLESYLHCVSMYFGKHHIPQILEKQFMRDDLDTVCGYELLQMKTMFLDTDVLEYKRFLEPLRKF
jgi:hypothetical protein